MHVSNTIILLCVGLIASSSPALGQASIPQNAGSLARITRPALSPAAARIRNVKPGFINNLAGARLSGITNSQTAQINGRQQKAFIKGLTGPAPGQLPSDSRHNEQQASEAAQEFGIKPVAYVGAAAPRLGTTVMNKAIVHHLQAPDLEETASGLHVQAGDFILETTDAVDIHIPAALVATRAGTVLKISASTEGGRIINLSDKKRDSVVVHICEKKFVLKPGQECHFSLRPEFVEEKLADGCGRRNHRDSSCCTYKIKINEVSVAALLKHNPLGRQLFTSKNGVHKNLTGSLLKTAAALAVTSKAKTPYEWH